MYYSGVMEDMEVIPCNYNPKNEFRSKHLTNGARIFMPFLGTICQFFKPQIQAPYKF